MSDNPSRTICDFISLLGRNGSDPILQEAITSLPYQVKEGSGGPVVTFETRGKKGSLTLERAAGILMSNLRDTSARIIGDDVRHAVVAVPTSFNSRQKESLKAAGHTYHLNVLRTVSAPTAAGIAYELDSKHGERNVVVLDLGASKSEATVLNIDQGVFEPLTTVSIPMGGHQLNKKFAQLIAAGCAEEGFNLDQQALAELDKEIEAAKRSSLGLGPGDYCTLINCHEKCPGLRQQVKMKKQVNDGMDEYISTAVFEPLKRALKNLNMKLEWEPSNPWFQRAGIPYIPSDIIDVESFVPVGGFSKMRTVAWLLKGLRHKVPKGPGDFDVDEAVLKGVAMQAKVLTNYDDNDGCRLFDVNLLSLGLETEEGYFRKIVPRIMPIPTRRRQNFTTAYDNQDSMLIRVFEGERRMARDNLLLGEFELKDIPPAPRHVPRVEVAFEVDNNTASLRGIEYSELERLVYEAEQEFEETGPVGIPTMERYVAFVEQAMDRGDVVDPPGAADDWKEYVKPADIGGAG
ncbi:hypothetical protein N8I77_005537 [Diaporthe amygdali]|uniref:Uncharacterized protein n=1 Tax=Phomopsis amygdali TaxID=1214568 RepID=A0AAD9SER9_PHOAM|nr:hypothetical protein N8I77_005537 [Diaporthe amygdali]